jgi:hypothetical protein
MTKILKILMIFLLVQPLRAEYEGPYFDEPTVIVDKLSQLPNRSDVEKVISLQTPVKRQRSRGTCTIFTTIGLLESHLIRLGLSDNSVDLSEEWLEYIMMTKKQTEGSKSSKNIKKVRFFGVVSEQSWPYLGEKWFVEPENIPQAISTCGHLDRHSEYWMSCLLGHRDPRLLRADDDFVRKHDPEFISLRDEALLFKEQFLKGRLERRSHYRVETLSEVKKKLLEGIPLIMGLKLYYGSWNHSKSKKLEIQKRDKKRWYKGIVTYPEPGSIDRRISGEKGGGHSLIIVGYDDEVVVHSRMLMEDGTWKEFQYKGVYYFKNSWGTHAFGKDFILNGKKIPGYGMITQKYAHEMGTFVHMPLE